jgi:hypothetical protein
MKSYYVGKIVDDSEMLTFDICYGTSVDEVLIRYHEAGIKVIFIFETNNLSVTPKEPPLASRLFEVSTEDFNKRFQRFLLKIMMMNDN